MNVRSRWFTFVHRADVATLVVATAYNGGTSSGDKTATATSAAARPPRARRQPPAALKRPRTSEDHHPAAEPEFYDPHRSNFKRGRRRQRILFRGLYNLYDDGKGSVKVRSEMAAARPAIASNVYTVRSSETGLKWSDEPASQPTSCTASSTDATPRRRQSYCLCWARTLRRLKGCDDLFRTDAAKQPNWSRRLASRPSTPRPSRSRAEQAGGDVHDDLVAGRPSRRARTLSRSRRQVDGPAEHRRERSVYDRKNWS